MNRKKILKTAVFAVIVVAVAAVLEVCAFNFKPIAVSLGWRQDETRTYAEADFRLVDCYINAGGEIEIGEGEAHLWLENLNYELNTMRVSFESGGISSVSAFCDSSTEDKTVTLANGAGNVVVDGNILSVRFDLQGETGDTLKNFTVIINDYQFRFSWARFIAMIAVCFITRGLFALQHPVDYGIDTSDTGAASAKKEEDKGEGESA